MDNSKLMAIEGHLKAALLLAEQANIGLLIYLLSMVLLEVQDRMKGRTRDN
ncbi:hypothetical protein [Agrobacterium sp. ICMP 6402]|uniref:hypothetical protein n=1 Tax=Agrobacterium sp. ICMP 6402 TaxID=2292443 RepID=UPI0012978382|nr:hypothetical protein [Agrobacterium sp. ICMP 6402]